MAIPEATRHEMLNNAHFDINQFLIMSPQNQCLLKPTFNSPWLKGLDFLLMRISFLPQRITKIYGFFLKIFGTASNFSVRSLFSFTINSRIQNGFYRSIDCMIFIFVDASKKIGNLLICRIFNGEPEGYSFHLLHHSDLFSKDLRDFSANC